jgi:hypothetical protein
MTNKLEFIRTFNHSRIDRQDYHDLFESVAVFVAMEQGASAEDVLEEGFFPLKPEAYEKRYIGLMYNILKKADETGNADVVRAWTQSFPVRRSSESSRND